MELAWKGGAMRRARLLSFINHHYSLFIIISSFLFITSLAACSSDPEPTPTPTPTPEPVVSTEVAITFSGHEEEEKAVNNGSTRAETRAGTPLDEMGVTQFNVWGYKNMSYSAPSFGDRQEVFPGYTVKWLANSAATTTTNSSGWEYILLDPADQTIKYWDWAAKAYRFFAATGWNKTTPATPAEYVATEAYGTNGTYGGDGTYWTSGTYKTYQIKMLANCSDEDSDDDDDKDLADVKANMDKTPFFSHLWFSTDELPTYADKRYGKPVQLEFLKPYARVRFIFKYVYPREGIELKKKVFKLATDFDSADPVGIARKGIVTVSYPTEGPEIKEWYSVAVDADKSTRLAAFTEDCDPEDDSKVYTETDGGWYYVLPNLTQGAYKMAVWMNADDVSAEATRTAVVPAEYMRWLPGYSYTYIFKILEEGGVEIELVQAAVTPWTDMEADHDVYNW